MRILLKDNRTGLFYIDAGYWTISASHAYDFHSSGHALAIALKHRLPDVTTVFQFSDPAMNFSIPITPHREPGWFAA